MFIFCARDIIKIAINASGNCSGGQSSTPRKIRVRTFDADGFSLIEVLVSILVLSLGVIGAAAMQLTGLRTTQQSGYQSVALQLASELADKMRANDSQMKQIDGANPFLAIDYKSAEQGEPASPGSCYGISCSGAELAEFDIYEWKKRIKAGLPAGRAVVCRDAAPWDSANGSLRWSCNGGPGSSLVIKVGWQAKNPDGSLIEDANSEFPPSVALIVEPYLQ